MRQKNSNDKKQEKQLNFLFQEDGFCIDDRGETLSGVALSWKKQFTEHPFLALYRLGFVEKPKEFNATGQYLYRVSDTFLRVLTGQSDIEVAREDALIFPDEDIVDRLLDSVPFTLGSETMD